MVLPPPDGPLMTSASPVLSSRLTSSIRLSPLGLRT
ncbi:Uncharacterised protein [Mycobacteroides abscessus subsp. abscessus]|nr:Uncharacterised protein [Mycobacteroides abscessus subsp. abscessus]